MGALIYSIEIDTKLGEKQVMEILAKEFNSKLLITEADSPDQYWTLYELLLEGLVIQVVTGHKTPKEIREDQDYSDRRMGFRPTINISFHRDKPSWGAYEEGLRNILRATQIILENTTGDAVLIYGDYPIILQRKAGELVLFQERWQEEPADSPILSEFLAQEWRLPHRIISIPKWSDRSLELATEASVSEMMNFITQQSGLNWDGKVLKGEGILIWAIETRQLNNWILIEQLLGKFGYRPRFPSPDLVQKQLGFRPNIHIGFRVCSLDPYNMDIDESFRGYFPGELTMLRIAMKVLKHFTSEAILVYSDDDLILQWFSEQLTFDRSFWVNTGDRVSQELYEKFRLNELRLPYTIAHLPLLSEND